MNLRNGERSYSGPCGFTIHSGERDRYYLKGSAALLEDEGQTSPPSMNVLGANEQV